MSKRAEEAAMKAHPVKERWKGNQYGEWGDLNIESRKRFQEGYHQAEKDLALTWKDVADIVILADTIMDGHEEEWKKLGPEAYYSAVLRAYKDAKG